MVKEDGPGIQAHTEAVHRGLLERVLVEESEEFQDREVRVELDPLEVRRHKPEEEIAALGQEPAQKQMVDEKAKGACVVNT